MEKAMLELRARKNYPSPCWAKTRSDRDDPPGLKGRRIVVSISQLCRWFEVPRRTFYYQSVKAPPKVQPTLPNQSKAMIGTTRPLATRTVAHLLGFNKNTVQRVFQLRGWQVRKRPVGFRPRIEARRSGHQPNERWATDLCRVWAGRLAGPHWHWWSLLQPGVAGLACLSGSRPPLKARWSRP